MIALVEHSFGSDVGAGAIWTGALPGKVSVGVAHFHAVDESRGGRAFMGSVFYPAEAGEARARFVDLFEPAVERALAEIAAGVQGELRERFLSGVLGIGMQAFRAAKADLSGRPYPLLIYYPGGNCNRFASVDVCEGLASLGYVVFAMEGPGDSPLMVFPDGCFVKGPLEGDYISPGVGDVSFLLARLEEINAGGALAGMLDLDRVGIFGHSRGGYIANISAFLHERVKAAASIDSFLWGYMSDGTGLERHPAEFQQRVRSTAKPVLRVCGRPAGADARDEAAFCLRRDGGDFIGEVTVAALPGWGHADFVTTPWACGLGPGFLSQWPGRVREGAGALLVDLIGGFFDRHLRCAGDGFRRAVERHPSVGVVVRPEIG